jgi:RHS repeat-associated protein
VYLGGQPVIDLDQPSETSSPAGPGEAVIDTDQAQVVGANWQNKSHPLAINGSYLQNRKRDNRAVYWYIDGAERSGPHDVYVHWLNPDGSGYSTTYMVQVINGIDAAFDYEYVNITHGDHEDGDWVLLGNFNIKPYDPNARQFVGLSGGDNRGAEGTFLEADAVRIVPTGLADGDSSIHFIHGDHLGTPQYVSNEEGNVVWSASYRPFGSATVDEDVDGDGVAYEMNLRFPGQYFDGETGLHYNYYRTYDPELGRYLEPDPIGLEGGLNSYSYAELNPLLYSDSLGLDAELCQRPFYPWPIPYARHCFVRYTGGGSSSFGPNGAGQDPAPEWWPRSCRATEGGQDDDCMQREMKSCRGEQYDFLGFNCCHCVERAMRICGVRIPSEEWPNWPVNPGPQPGEPGYEPDPRRIGEYP